MSRDKYKLSFILTHEINNSLHLPMTQGDSGGPLVMEDDQSGLFTLIGVVTGESLFLYK